MKKRILPALLALCMVMSLLPAAMLNASAAGEEATKCPTCGCYPICDDCKPEAEASAAPSAEATAAPTPTPTPDVGGNVTSFSGRVTFAAMAAAPETPCECKAGEVGTGHSCGATCNFQICGIKECTNYDKYEDVTAGHTLTNTECNALLSYCTKGDADPEATGHVEDTCPIVCKDVPGCTKTQGHKTAHTETGICTGDKRCGATTHLANCESDAAKASPSPDVTATAAPEVTKNIGGVDVPVKKGDTTVVVLERVVEVYVACTCEEKHDANDQHVSPTATPAPTTCPNATAVQPTAGVEAKGVKVKLKVSIQVEVPYQWEVKYVIDEHGNPELDDNSSPIPETTINEKAKADAKAKAEKAAKADADNEDYDAKFSTALTTAVSNYEALNKPLCSLCAGQGVVVCTMGRECGAKSHEDNCLKLCTGDKDCPNDAGVATAHQVTYVIQKTAKVDGKVTKEAGTYDVKSVAADTAKALNAKAKADAGEGSAPAYTYAVVAVYCPAAGIPDSVVVTADGEDVEKPAETDEVKAPEKAEDFADVTADAWYAEELTALVEKGIFKGVLDTEKNEYNFEPKTEMNTETLVVLIGRVLGEDIKDGEGSAWAQPSVEWAAEKGLTEGVETGKITRADVALVLWRAADKPEPSEKTSLEAFEDVAELEGDSLTAMKWAYEVGIFKGDKDAATMRPAGVINRAEMVAVIARFDGVVNAD